MVAFLLETGIYNPTFWVVFSLWVALIAGVRIRWDRLNSRIFLGLLFLGTGAVVSESLLRAYLAPRDVMQDIISAKEWLAGSSMEPDRMNERMRQALEEEEPRPIPRWPARLHEAGRSSREEIYASHWVQAHPPITTLITAIFVGPLGILGAQFALLLLAFASLGWILFLIYRYFGEEGERPHPLLSVLLVLGWSPVLTVFRNGQWDLLLAALLVSSWHCTRGNRLYAAGVLVGLATAIKVFPAVILLFLLLRHRKAFMTGCGTILVLSLLVVVLCGIATIHSYVETARGVVEEYADFPSNISLLGLIVRAGTYTGWDLTQARAIWIAAGLIIVLGIVWVLRPNPLEQKQTTDVNDLRKDLKYALAMSLMPLCSPVAWNHYLTLLVFPFAVLIRSGWVGRSRGAMILTATIAMIVSIPEGTYLWLFRQTTQHGMRSIAVWILEPLRTYALLVTAICLGWLRLNLRRHPDAKLRET